MAVPAQEWLALIEREYLADFITAGGAAVKFAVGDNRTIDLVRYRLREASRRHRLEFISIDAADTRLHMIQDIFFAVARSLPWHALAQQFVEALFNDRHYQWPTAGSPVAMPDLAAANRIDIGLLRRDIKQWLTREIMQDTSMTQDFRAAMSEMCLQRMELTAPGAAPELPITEWLKGELRTIGALKSASIMAKITRYNGRPMLRSLCRWLRKCGKDGLCVTLDIRRLGEAGKPGDDRLRYGPGAVMDGFEVLRQLVDDIDRCPGLLLVVLADDTLISGDRTRSLDAYLALKMRIWSDVHPEDRDDPLAPLVSLTASPDTTTALVAAPP